MKTKLLNKFIHHSGGARGSDIAWSEIGKEYGLIQSNHYYIEGYKTPYGNVEIPTHLKLFADPALKIANATLKRTFPTSNEYVNNLLRRNYWQVINSDAIYAIGSIVDNMVTGGTAWAVSMAIVTKHIPVYIFDQITQNWYKCRSDRSEFVKCDIPILTINFGGIGTREIDSNGLNAIHDVYKKTIQNI